MGTLGGVAQYDGHFTALALRISAGAEPFLAICASPSSQQSWSMHEVSNANENKNNYTYTLLHNFQVQPGMISMILKVLDHFNAYMVRVSLPIYVIHYDFPLFAFIRIYILLIIYRDIFSAVIMEV